MKFKEVLTRLTGVSCPVFGISWNPPEAEIAVARRVLAYLEDRRVLYRPYDMEVPEHCVESVVQMRRFLTDEIAKLDTGKEIAQTLRGIKGHAGSLQEVPRRLSRIVRSGISQKRISRTVG
jgi:hypothetical protein